MSANLGAVNATFDRRLPVVVVVPQLVLPIALAGDPMTGRLAFMVTVVGNVPVALAGRVFDLGPTGSRHAGLTSVLEWSRPVAAWLYSLLLLSMDPFTQGELQAALLSSAIATAIGGALMYVAPGRCTPAGERLHQRNLAGATWKHEPVAFASERASHVLAPIGIVIGWAFGSVMVAVFVVLLACACALLAATLRPRNAAGFERRSPNQRAQF